MPEVVAMSAKMRAVERSRIGVLALVLSMLVCCVRAENEDVSQETRLVREVALGIIAADNARDLSRVLSLYAEDAVLLPPNEAAVRGKAAIRPRYEALFRDYMPEIVGEIDEVQVGGRWAFVIGTTRGRLLPVGGGEARSLNDAYVMILRRTSGGSWHIGRLMWHPIAPAAAAGGG